MILAEIVEERAQEKISGLRRAFTYGNAVQQQFWSEHPDWRQKLTAACQLRLEKAKAELATITKVKGERLSDYDDDEVQHSPPIRRAAHAVRKWESQAKAIQNAVPEACWVTHVGVVLSSDDE